jgi:hypothetical protein
MLLLSATTRGSGSSLRLILKIATLPARAALIPFAIIAIRSHEQFKAHFIRAL